MTVISEPRHLVLASLASGSRGNCTYIGDGVTGVLIDCGLTENKVRARLEQCGLGRKPPIDAILLTHKHGDHAANARVLANKLGVPVLMSRGTHHGLLSDDRRLNAAGKSRKKKLAPNPDKIRIFDAYPDETGAGSPYSFYVRGDSGDFLNVEAITDIPHDTPTTAFRVGRQGVWATVLTDFGRATPEITEFIRPSSILLLEFNHEVRLLQDYPEYSDALKERIGNTHMCNPDSSALLVAANPPDLKCLILGHISEKANRPEMAHGWAKEAVRQLQCHPPILIGRQAGMECHVAVALPQNPGAQGEDML